MTIVHVLISVEDDWYFWFLVFLKNEFQAILYSHFAVVINMYNQQFFSLEIFFIVVAFDDSIGITNSYGVLA